MAPPCVCLPDQRNKIIDRQIIMCSTTAPIHTVQRTSKIYNIKKRHYVKEMEQNLLSTFQQILNKTCTHTIGWIACKQQKEWLKIEKKFVLKVFENNRQDDRSVITSSATVKYKI